MSNYSVIIKNGLVFDGKNNKPEKTDVGIEKDQIKKVGDLAGEAAQSVIDAEGKCVAPGFIDITSHSDTHWTIFSSPFQKSLIAQGVTTIVGGNCGVSLAPFLGEESAKEIRRWVDMSKININWRTMGEFLNEMERHGLGLNFGTFVGLNTIRRGVIGDNQRLGKMKILLKSALEEGVFGVTTNFGWAESDYFSDPDAVELFKILADYGAVSKHHLEDEGQNMLPAVSRMIGISRKSGAKMHISHFKALGKGSWESFEGAFNIIKNARDGGVKITYDFFPYTRTGSSLISLLPAWFKKYSDKEARKILSSKYNKTREELKSSLKKLTLHYDKIIVASALAGVECAGKTVEKIASDAGQSGEETILSLLLANDLRVSIFNEVISEANMEAIAKDQYSAVSSDGVGYDFSKIDLNDLPHPRSYGSFPRVMSQFVKNKKIISWENAIYKMTGLPAEIIGLKDRGSIAKGKKADIVVFNQDEIADEATYDAPYKYPKGIEAVFVNGQISVYGGKFYNNLSGEIIKRK